MTFDEYLHLAKGTILRIEKPIEEDEFVSNVFEKIIGNRFEDFDVTVQVKPIYSKSVFPEVVTFRKGYYILWDMLYWGFFEHFFQAILCFDQKQEKYYEVAKQNLLRIAYLFLSHKLEKYPYVSFILAKQSISHIRDIDNMISATSSSLPEGIYGTKLSIAKIFVFCHELTHIEYKLKPELYHRDLSIIKAYLAKIMLTHLEDDSFFTNMNKFEIDKINQVYQYIINETDRDFIVEIMCDFFALRECIEIIKVLNPKANIENVVYTVHASARVCMMFQNLFKNINSSWKSELDACNSIYLKSILNNGNVDNDYIEIVGTADIVQLETFTRMHMISRLFAADCLVHYGFTGLPDDYFNQIESIEQLASIYNPVCERDTIINIYVQHMSLLKQIPLNSKQVLLAKDIFLDI